jgi:hypothetical protein
MNYFHMMLFFPEFFRYSSLLLYFSLLNQDGSYVRSAHKDYICQAIGFHQRVQIQLTGKKDNSKSKSLICILCSLHL